MMVHSKISLVFVTLAISTGFLFAPAQSQEPTTKLHLNSRNVRVATRIIPPFVIRDGDALGGFSIDLWNRLAKETDLNTDFQVVGSLPLLLGAVRDHRADIGIAAISITAEREREFDFSVPMFDAGLQIVVPVEPRGGSALLTLRRITGSAALYEFVGLLLLITFILAHLIWLFERRHNEGIVTQAGYISGISKAIWWSASALGGQAEEMPRSVAGRVVAVVWLFAAIVLTSSFIAIVTTSLTVDRLKEDINGPQDLQGKRIATVVGSTSAAYLQAHDAIVEAFPNIQDAFHAAENGRVNAVVYDSPVLQYYVAHEGNGNLRLVGSIFRKESYGILFSPNDPRRKLINEALLRLRETGEYDTIYQKWFGKVLEDAR